jgi:hypothetical protein
MVWLYDGSLQVQLRRSDCGYISLGPTPITNKSEVIFIENPHSPLEAAFRKMITGDNIALL